jgi:hypothetical protein
MKRKVVTLAILLVLLLGVVGIIYASDLCTKCNGTGTVCPLNPDHRIEIPSREDPNAAGCTYCGITFSKFNCRSCGGKGYK